MNTAIRIEVRKLLRSPVGTIGTLALIVGTLALLGGITAALASGDPELTAKAGSAATLDWNGLLSAAAQITSAGGCGGFGIVLAWVFGREFADGTVSGLFALPIGRGRIALAKLVAYAAWAVAVAVILTLAIVLLGLVLGYGAPSAGAWAGIGRQALLTLLTAALVSPVAWIATVTRSLLAAIGAAIGLLVVAEVGALAGAGGWMPLAAPALWALSDGSAVTPVQLSLTVVFAIAFAALACASWARLQLRR